MKKENIVNSVKMILLAVVLILLFFVAEAFVNFLVAIKIEVLKKIVYVIFATCVITIYNNGKAEE